MKIKKYILFLVFFIINYNIFAQCDFSVNIKYTHPKCNENNGLIQINTDAVTPTFSWSNGLNDTIATNLAGGWYYITIKDISGCEKTESIFLSNFSTNPQYSLPDASFTYSIKNNGFVEFTNLKSGIEEFWTFGDGEVELGINPVHKYSNSNSYEVCHYYKNICGSDTTCLTIPVQVIQKQLETGKSTSKLQNGNLPQNFVTERICECNNKLFFIGNEGFIADPFTIYSLDLLTESLVKLPVTYKRGSAIGGNFDFKTGFICKNNLLYFGGNNGITGNELYKSDGTISGTQIVVDYSVGSYSSDPYDFFIFNNQLYYKGFHSVQGYSRGATFTSNGNTISEVANEYYSSPQVLNNHLIYNDCNGLLKSVVNVGDTPLILFNSNYSACNTTSLGVLNGYYIFYFYDSINGTELWRTDGTIAGTTLIKDIRQGINSSYVYESSIFYNGSIYFVANDGINGEELWRTDGTPNGTVLVKDINNGSSNSSPSSLIVVDNLLFFTANTPQYGRELWKTDGTNSGTIMLYDGYPGSYDHIARYSSFIKDGNDFYYNAYLSGTSALLSANSNSTTYKIMSIQDYNCTPDNGGQMYKTSTNSYYYSSGSYSSRWISKICTYQKPFVNDTLVVVPANYSTPISYTLKANGILGASYKWYLNNNDEYCGTNISNTSSVYSFNSYNSTNIKVRSISQEGCPSPNDRVTILRKNEPIIQQYASQRCTSTKLVVYVSFPNGKFGTNNTFRAFISGSGVPSTEIPLDFDNNNTFTITLPSGIPDIQGPYNYSHFVQIFSSNPNKESLFILVPSVSNLKFSIFNDKTINEGELHSIYLSMGVNTPLPYSVKINGINFQNILQDPFKITHSLLQSKKYIISDFSNACENGMIEKNTTVVKVNKPCISSLNHSNLIKNNNYFVQNEILSQGIINDSGIVEYNFGKSLSLLPGFSIQKGGYFKAEVKNCN